MRLNLHVCEKLWTNRFCKTLTILCLYVKSSTHWHILILYYLPILNLLSNVLESNWKLSLKKLFCRWTTGRGTSVRHICGGGICGCGGEGGNGSRILSKLWICWTLGSGRKSLVLSIFTTNVPPYTEIENKWKINGIEASADINRILYFKKLSLKHWQTSTSNY